MTAEALFAPEEAWALELENDLTPADTPETVAVAMMKMPAIYAHRGVRWHIQEPEAVVLVQRQAAGEHSPCAHCGGRHPMLILQVIHVKEQRKGHGKRIVRGLLSERNGVYLQSVVSKGGAALARSLGMTERPYEMFSWDLCTRAKAK